MNASELMTKNVACVRTGASIAEAVRLMLTRGVSGLPVLDDGGNLVGIVSEGDLLRRAELGTERRRPAWVEFLRGPGRQAADYVLTHARKVDDVMTRDPVAVDEGTPAETVVSLMQERRIKRVPVLRDGRLAGIVSRADLLRALLPCLAPSPAEDASDEHIRDWVEVALTAERWAPREGVKVECKDGIVTLTGVIFEERDRDALRVAAERVPGVKGVRDELVWVEPVSGMTVTAADLVASGPTTFE
jgi:CBS domain-containing protein